MKTPAGLVNQKIEIYSDQDVRNNSAGVDPNSALYWATTARVERLGAPRNLGQMLEQFTPTFRFTVNDRIDKNVQANMLIKYRGEWFTILSAEPDFVYRDSLVMTAVTGKLPQRSGTGVYRVYYGARATNDTISIEDLLQLDYIDYTLGSDLIVTFGTDYNFAVLAFPTGMPIPNKYENQNDTGDNGDIGAAGQFLSNPYIVGDFTVMNGSYLSVSNDPLKLYTE